MELQEYNAREIVREINSVLPQKINLFNKRGIIIASTDTQRIGTFHGGAARVIQENLDELRIYSRTEYPGARPGTNFILRVDGEPIGVLGITGAYEDILPLAQVIRKMTELIVRDQRLTWQQARQEHQRQQILSDLLMRSETFVNNETVEQAAALGIDLRIPRRVLAVGLLPGQPDVLLAQSYAAIAQRARQIDHTILSCQTRTALFLLTRSQRQDSLLDFAQQLRGMTAPALPVCIGIDNFHADAVQLHAAAREAQKALLSCLRKGNVFIKFYDQINMEIFADDIPDKTKHAYIHKIFSDYSEQELQEAIHTLEVFFEHDGSIERAAAALFIHKNTLQLHLRKIAQRTGYDPRSLRNSAVFYLVIYFYQDLHLLQQSL